jgi:hypothetical protein
MNYIELINRAWSLREQGILSAKEQELYFFLLHKCNSLKWKNPFNQSTQFVCAFLGINRNALTERRNSLSQLGLISFKEGDKGKNKPAEYCICIPKCIEKDTLTNTLTNTLTDTKRKLKETKQNNNLKPSIQLKDDEANENSFEKIWELYERKGNKKTSMQKWANLKNHCREAIFAHVPLYVQSTPDKQYRKNFETYLNQECWNDEVVIKNTSKSSNDTQLDVKSKLLNKLQNGTS